MHGRRVAGQKPEAAPLSRLRTGKVKPVRSTPPTPRSSAIAASRWHKLLEAVSEAHPTGVPEASGPVRIIHYRVKAAGIFEGRDLALEILQQEHKKSGGWGALKELNLARTTISKLPDPLDRQILAAIQGCPRLWDQNVNTEGGPFALGVAQTELLLPLLCATGRFTVTDVAGNSTAPLRLDEGERWRFIVKVTHGDGDTYRFHGVLRRGHDEEVELAEPALMLDTGWVFLHDRAARFDPDGAFPWITTLRQTGGAPIPARDVEPFLQRLFATPHLPQVELPSDLRIEIQTTTPQIRVLVKPHPYDEQAIRARLQFDYGQVTYPDGEARPGLLDARTRVFHQRNREAEQQAREQLRHAGFRYQPDHLVADFPYHVPVQALPVTLHSLLPLGWKIESNGRLYRAPSQLNLRVSSGTDWLELAGRGQFEGSQVDLPTLLKAVRSGATTVELDDGSLGLLPEDWLRRMELLSKVGENEQGHVRFQRGQALLLDALLAEQPNVEMDVAFAQFREELRNFHSVEPMDAPPGFHGTLRPYQREGLGWFDFLRRFGFGGCLADDMGLGKTVQVLALLERRRQEKAGPSLVVVPRSLVFNWKQEAARFTPALRILEHSGIGRARHSGQLSEYDLILTTYGTLRRDALLLKEITFDYAILDESQAIKNSTTHAAKAARVLRARHRLALSGTPVENHLGELWSLFEFLNPGLLGRSAALGVFAGPEVAPELRHLLARSIRPFILRRTKGQVAPELPARLEQTIYCELPPPQRKMYDELRAYYQQTLRQKIDQNGLSRSKLIILEALLRLRQVACHPGLIDPAHQDLESAKLSALIPQLTEVTQEGHKALVFSQFTSFLRLVRTQVEAAGLAYEYLDGKTKDRQARVERFQNDPDCRLFLISLRAGGLGLNLTSAEYVFLLDPWWNPAVEAQAIDRAHRIGQKQKVFAYRLIARNTIEEKVLELQAQKRDLVAAILTEDQSLLRTLTREDLELLLG